MKITSVAVLGAGAVGSYVIWGLANREDIKLGVIAEGERKERRAVRAVRSTERSIIRRCGHQRKQKMWIS